MCVIIDANQAHLFERAADLPYVAQVIKWVNGGGRIVTGGKLETELFRIRSMRGLLTEWQRSRRLIRVEGDRVDTEAGNVEADCESDDPHVVALARLSGAGVVVTEDQALMRDLKNVSLVGQRRRIYKVGIGGPALTRHHTKMLRNSGCKD